MSHTTVEADAVHVDLGPLPPAEVPLALVDVHRSLEPGARASVLALAADWPAEHLEAVLVGGGFAPERLDRRRQRLEARCVRARTLADTVGAGMRLLVCGLNPSIYAADRGVGFARPGNRFWPAARAAGLVTRDRDPGHALRAHGVGMTDLVKRATQRAAELTRDEYHCGVHRVARIVRWLEPRAVCFVGLAGYRVAVDRVAAPGAQPCDFAGVPAYVMPSTSGLNASSSLDDLVDHLRAAWALCSPGAPTQATSSSVRRSRVASTSR